MFERVPQCDFDGIAPECVCVDGDAYNYDTAYERYCLSVGEVGEQTRQRWRSMSHEDSVKFYEEESVDRARAHYHRSRLIDAMVESSSCVSYCAGDITFGAVWNLDVYYMYSSELDALWAYGFSPAPVIEAIGSHFELGAAGHVALRHLFVMAEFEFEFECS